MTSQFGRRIIVTVAGRLFTDHRIAATINRRASRASDDGIVDIYNLARPTEQHIFKRGGLISVEAGYEGSVGLIFEGSVQDVERVRRTSGGIARITRVQVGDGIHSPDSDRGQPLGGIASRSYDGAVAVRQVAADLIADTGLAAGSLAAIPDVTVTGWAYSGAAADGLGTLLRSVGCSFYADGDVVQVRRVGSPSRGDAPGFLVSPQTGLVGSPKDTDKGVDITTLLNPALEIGSGVRLQGTNSDGDYAVSELTHQASNWEGRHITSARCRSL